MRVCVCLLKIGKKIEKEKKKKEQRGEERERKKKERKEKERKEKIEINCTHKNIKSALIQITIPTRKHE